VQAVRQWRLRSQRQGTPVDVIVEVAVEFKIGEHRNELILLW
jgi:hypothetical protein